LISRSISIDLGLHLVTAEPMACLCPNHYLATSVLYCSCLSVTYSASASNNILSCFIGEYLPAQTTLQNVQACTSAAVGSTTLPKNPNIDFTVVWDQWTPDFAVPPSAYPARATYRVWRVTGTLFIYMLTGHDDLAHNDLALL
jgi:hypothetical protein